MIERLLGYAAEIPCDKVRHALIGLVVYTVIAMWSATVAIIIVAVIAIAKEVYDAGIEGHTPEPYDAIATAIIPLILYIIGVTI